MKEKVVAFVYGVGYFAEFVAATIAAYWLWLDGAPATVWAICVSAMIVSVWANHRWKRAVQSARPTHPVAFLAIDRFAKTHSVHGMPSGHAQFTAMYMGLLAGYTSIGQGQGQGQDNGRGRVHAIVATAVVLLAAIVQRYVYRNHTAAQLAVGTVVGLASGLGTGYVAYSARESRTSLTV